MQACLWQLPNSFKTAYWIYCCEVLEHIPQDSIDTVLAQMAQRMRFGGYFSICLKDGAPSKKINRPPMLTVKGKAWWEKKLQKHFTIIGEDAIADDLYFNCRVKAHN